MRAPRRPAPRQGRRAARRRERVARLRRREGADRCLLRHPQGRNPRHHRPERRRQDLDAELSSTASITRTQGRITFKGKTRAQMRPSAAARGGIARTFQNVALFKGMSTLDNIMAGRIAEDARGLLLAASPPRPGAEGGGRAPARGRGDHRLPRDPGASARRRSASCPTACRSASSSAARSPWSRTSCSSTSRWPA